MKFCANSTNAYTEIPQFTVLQWLCLVINNYYYLRWGVLKWSTGHTPLPWHRTTTVMWKGFWLVGHSPIVQSIWYCYMKQFKFVFEANLLLTQSLYYCTCLHYVWEATHSSPLIGFNNPFKSYIIKCISLDCIGE